MATWSRQREGQGKGQRGIARDPLASKRLVHNRCSPTTSPFLRGRRKGATGQAQTTERPDACASANAERAPRVSTLKDRLLHLIVDSRPCQ